MVFEFDLRHINERRRLLDISLLYIASYLFPKEKVTSSQFKIVPQLIMFPEIVEKRLRYRESSFRIA